MDKRLSFECILRTCDALRSTISATVRGAPDSQVQAAASPMMLGEVTASNCEQVQQDQRSQVDRILTAHFFKRAGYSHMWLRLGSTLWVAFALAFFRIVSVQGAAFWVLACVASEIAFALLQIAFNRHKITQQAFKTAIWRHVVVVAGASMITIYAAPTLFTANTSPLGAMLGAMYAAAVMMIVVGQYDLSRLMCFVSLPVPAAGLTLNVLTFVHGPASWLIAGAVGGYIVNVLYLQGCNVSITRSMAVAQVEAEASNVHLMVALDRVAAASEAKSAFLANMSHEIRTPLNGVLGMTQVMSGDELTGVQRGRLEVVRRSGQTLMVILNDVLDISKIESGRIELEELPFDLLDLVANVHLAFLSQAEAKDLTFSLDAEPSLKGFVLGDPTRVRQIILNLVSNAVKFTSVGQVSLSLAREGASWVKISVRDTGQGLTSEQIPRLFNKFVQADASTTRQHGGTGLGLAISRELARLMGGDIEVESIAGAGSSFVLRLPLAPTAAPEASAIPFPDDAAIKEPSQLRILAAEDNPVNQLVLKTLLSQAGLELTVVGDGQQALDAWRGQEWDLILMDVQMPVMDGPTATSILRREEAANGRQRTPILALTANVMHHQLDAYRIAGMDGHVAKPIDVGKLFGAFAEMLDGAATGKPDTAVEAA